MAISTLKYSCNVSILTTLAVKHFSTLRRLKSSVRGYAFTVLMLFLCFPLIGQKLIESRQTSYYTYIYQLSDEEAETIYTSKIWEVNPAFFHTLVDSFPTDSVYEKRLPKGHYIKTFADKNEQKIAIATVQDFNIYVLNNNTDLRIQVYDLKGNIIPDATLKVKNKRLRFDKKTQCYIEKKSNRKGLLEVTHDGFTAYYNLSRNRNNSGLKRGFQKVVYGTPLKYVWRPVRFVVGIPVDGVRSIVKGYPRGSIARIRNFFRYPAGIFERRRNNRKKHKGYIVFNKPKYLPGDTVKFKAFLITKKGKPIDKDIDVQIQSNGKYHTLTRLKPYRKGGYEYEFFLHDSLQLQLDKNYFVYLKSSSKKWKRYITGSFRYEDYELTSTQLAVRLDDTEQFRNQDRTLYIKGTDENELNILDGRIEVLVKPKSVYRYFDNQVFVPDTLLFEKQQLDPVGETEIVLPDSLFPKINLDYEIDIKLLTSDNEVKTDKKTVSYRYESEAFDMEVLTDSIRFFYTENGIEKPEKVEISAGDNFGNYTPVYSGVTPCKLEVNPYYASYTIESDILSETISMNRQSSLLNCYAERTKDSIFVEVDNPRKIPFNYNIYKKNTEKNAGYSDSLNLKKKTRTKQNYFISISYLWAGKVVTEDYQIPLKNRRLKVTVTEPKIVYPGQKTQIEVLVTDTNGKPVENVDVTAYGLTKKFGYNPPRLPDFNKERKGKSLINNFNTRKDATGTPEYLKLDYDAWKIVAGLDSIEYYKFIYPKDSIYRFEYEMADSVTQFAPFVVKDGAIQPIHVIYVDNKPVYFSWSGHRQPYSFKIRPGFHQIQLRTNHQDITMDSLYFEKGKKLIFSLNDDIQLKNIRINKVKSELSDSEKRLLYKYMFPYRNRFGNEYAYLEQGGRIQVLNPGGSRYNWAGPIVGEVNFHLIDSFSTTFMHEPFFEYDFAPNLLKMRSVNEVNYPRYLNRYATRTTLADEYLTKAAFYKEWENYIAEKQKVKPEYFYPKIASKKTGRLEVSLVGEMFKEKPLYMLLFRQNDNGLIAIYPGNTYLKSNLEAGEYKLVFYYEDERYHVENLQIKPYGRNYYQYSQAQFLSKDNFSDYLKNIIKQTIFPIKEKSVSQQTNKETKPMPTPEYQYTGDVIEGYVRDESGEVLPFANVFVKGTTIGTVTDIDGYYSLKVPFDSDVLVISYTGYSDQEMRIGSSNIVNATLNESTTLDEVVVVGYGSARREQAVVEVESSRKRRKLDDSYQQISRAVRKPSGEPTIRGTSSVGTNTPLYIINGNVYSGDISEIDPASIKNIKTLQGSEATALYGAKAKNGVLIIETIAGTLEPSNKGADFDDAFFEAASQASSIRENFSDYAFWQPTLNTDKDGKATFELTFPDDVTSWQTHYLAMTGKRQSGQAAGFVKSYKPLMAQVAIPRFLIENDTTYAIGKVLNYASDSVKVNTTFELDGKALYSNTEYCTHSIIDTLTVIAQSDSISVQYMVENQDGYFDGERRDIPVFPIGLEETEGQFYVLDKDTTINLNFNPQLGMVNLYARADVLEVIEDEIKYLMRYKYLCNEQIASKLKGLLVQKKISAYKEEEFKYDKNVNKLIGLLKKNRKGKRLWGWWSASEQSEWISLHVLEAMMEAEKMGYRVNINKNLMAKELVYQLEDGRNFYKTTRLLHILHLLDAQIDAPKYIANLEKMQDTTFNHLAQVMHLKQLYKVEYDMDTLNSFKQTTLFGNIYFEESQKGRSRLLFNDVQNTILAYKVLRADSTNHDNTLAKMRNYFMENRRNGYWRNTYESAQIIETILPDLLGDKKKLTKPKLNISGDVNEVVAEFPFEMKVEPNQQIQVAKSGDFPVYFTAYQLYHNRKPEIKKDDFEITTKFENQPGRDAINRVSTLTAGQKTKLIVEVTVKKDAEYVMINVPIPGGCSYADKRKYYRNEVHREYFKNETAIFCQKLSKGKYIYEINLTPRYSGNYTLNPAKVELMYFPVFNANNEIKKVRIE